MISLTRGGSGRDRGRAPLRSPLSPAAAAAAATACGGGNGGGRDSAAVAAAAAAEDKTIRSKL